MPPKLGSFDSFNSSGATIVPDRSLRASSTLRAIIGYESDPYAPHVGGDDGVPALEAAGSSQSTQSSQPVAHVDGRGGAGAPGSQPRGSMNDSFYRQLDEINGPSARMGLLQNDNHGVELLKSLGIPTTASGNFDFEAMAREQAAHTSSPPAVISPSAIRGDMPPFVPFVPARPGSAVSAHSDHSARSAPHATVASTHAAYLGDSTAHAFAPTHRGGVSDYSLSSTDVSDDMDTDGGEPELDMDELAQDESDADGPSGAGGGAMGRLNLGEARWVGHHDNMSPASTVASGAGPSGSAAHGGRRATTMASRKRVAASAKDDDEKSLLDKLEHRRDINRRSARKHRKQRKEEVESLHAAVAERDKQLAARDQTIAHLEAEVKAMKSQLQQLNDILARKLAA